MKCSCHLPGYCPRFDKQMVGRFYQICRDECDPPLPGGAEKRLAYLRLWSRQANRITGLGDVVNMITRMTGIKSLVTKRAKRKGKTGCSPCKKRQEKLNEMLPLG